MNGARSRQMPWRASRSVLLALAVFATVGVTGRLAAESIVPGGRDDPPSAARGAFVVAPPVGAPGELVRVYAHGGGGPAAVELVDAEGETVVHAPAIEVRMTGAVTLRAYLIGIDSTRQQGSYRLRGVSPRGETVFEREIQITEHGFRAERIALNRSLTSLRSDYDPRKVEQTRILTELVLSRDPEALYHFGELRWPLPQETRLTSLFGDRRTYVYSDGSEAAAVHTGLDLAAPVGTPVRSSGRGIVRMAADRIVTGKTVVVEHLPGVYSLYYHLDEVRVTVGEVVGLDSVVGTVGATGLATGPHLHWEIRVGGVPVSPTSAAARALVTGVAAGTDDADTGDAGGDGLDEPEATETVP